MSPVVVYILVSCGSLALMRFGYSRFDSNFAKQFLNLIIGGWTLLYAGLVPLASQLLEVADPVYESYYLLGAVLLLSSQALAFVALSWVRAANPTIAHGEFGKAYWPTFVMVLIILGIAAMSLFFSEAARYADPLLNLAGLPGVTALYFGALTARRLALGAVLHLVIFALAVRVGLLLDSKELFVVYIVGPPIFAYFARMKKLSAIRGGIAMVVVGALFLLAVPIVHSTRHQLDLDLLSLQELFQFRTTDVISNALSRLLVLDALARTLANEFSGAPIRPGDPSWTAIGVIFALMPAFFERPDHAREALLMTGYLTSSIEVNIAVTYIGHLMWSFSIEWLAISAICFWVLVFKITQLALLLRGELSMIYLFSAAYSFLRLETLANVVAGRLLLAFVALAVVHAGIVVFTSRKSSGRSAGSSLVYKGR